MQQPPQQLRSPTLTTTKSMLKSAATAGLSGHGQAGTMEELVAGWAAYLLTWTGDKNEPP